MHCDFLVVEYVPDGTTTNGIEVTNGGDPFGLIVDEKCSLATASVARNL